MKTQIATIAGRSFKQRLSNVLFFACARFFVSARAVLSFFSKRRTTAFAMVTPEFFHEELNGFGGFGMTVKNITDRFNGAGRYLVDVLLSQGGGNRSSARRYHAAEVFLVSRDRGNALANALRQLDVFRVTTARNWRLLITMEYYRNYENWLKSVPNVPVLIWLRDPRTIQDWARISTVSMKTEMPTTRSIEQETEITRASLQEIARFSRTFGRPVLFAYQAHCLLPKARALYQMGLEDSFLMRNPIYIPKSVVGKEKRPSVCLLGRLDPIKRPWIYFELAKRFPSVTFYVLGQTHFSEVMQPYIERYRNVENVRFMGRVHGDVKYELLQKSWALLNTSIHEAMPVSFEEAFACATPVISCLNPDETTSKYGWFTGEILGDGLDAASLDKFNVMIEEMLTDPKGRAEKGAAAREYAQNEHSFERFEANLASVLGRIEGKGYAER